MKKIIAALLLVFSASLVLAHAPDGIRVETDLAKSKVKIYISHTVKDAAQHFIYEIEVKINGKKAIRQDAATQTSMTEQAVVYIVPGLKAGDKIEVYAECNKGGDIKKTFAADNTAKKEDKAEKKDKK